MSDKIEKLRNLGCAIDDAMERFLEDEEFYLECYEKVIHDSHFESLKAALESHNLQESFDCAHTLKGLVANLGLTSLNDIIVRMVEPLRDGSDDGLLSIYQDLMTERDKYLRII